MNRGVVFFAHNNGTTDYYAMAMQSARRVSKFLDLPVTVITDEESQAGRTGEFDKTIMVTPNASNTRKKITWINKGRYEIFDLSPYDETLLLDTDFMINSSRLLDVFLLPSDFVCHQSTFWITREQPEERLSAFWELGVQSLWATVVRFRKTPRAQQIFQMMQMVQENYEHYSNIYGFLPGSFRNDFALTVAHKTVNGHLQPQEDFIPWNLIHVDNNVQVQRDDDTGYTMTFDPDLTSKMSYIKVRNLDFHMLGKRNYLEITG